MKIILLLSIIIFLVNLDIILSSHNKLTSMFKSNKVEIQKYVLNYENTEKLQIKNKINHSQNESFLNKIYYGSVTFNTKDKELVYQEKYVEESTEDVILIARGRYNKSLFNIGWSKLFIETFEKFSNEIQSFCAGYIEGRLTSNEIFEFYTNLVKIHKEDESELIKVFNYYKEVEISIRKRIREIKISNLKRSREEMEYLLALSFVQSQTDGLYMGYNSNISFNKKLSFDKFYFINADGEVPELISVFKKESAQNNNFSFKQQKIEKFSKAYLKKEFGTSNPEEVWHKLILKSHCTAVIKCIYDENKQLKDVLVSHTTWDSFSQMHRIFKVYDFKLSLGLKRKSLVLFSSYPGTLTSTDDFYLIDSKISVLETTIEIIDKDLYAGYSTSSNNHIPNYIRISIANRLANSGYEWTELFKKNNSGTYNSQWMIIDHSKLKKISHEGLFYVLEQIPGKIECKDLSLYLIENGFWESFNRPYFNSIYVRTGFEEMYRRYGKTYSYFDNDRANIISSKIKLVNGVDDLKELMHSSLDNNGLLSFSSISPRFDLVQDEKYKRTSGGIDTKITSSEMIINNKVEAISGPSYKDNGYIFNWKEFPNDSHVGLPEEWRFDWVKFDINSLKNE